jgi:glutathione S-transferase
VPAMIQLFGNPVSTCTRKVLTALAETETPYTMNVIDFAKAEHKQQAHLGRQPFGQVPAIDDDGFALFESRAICRYLSDKSGGKLTPSDIKQRAMMEQWLSVEQSNFSPHAMKFIYEFVFKRPQGAAVLEAATEMIEKTYAALAKPLEKSSFIVGSQFTIADIGYMPYIEYLTGTPAQASLAKFPSVAAWWERVSNRPSWRKVAGR